MFHTINTLRTNIFINQIFSNSNFSISIFDGGNKKKQFYSNNEKKNYKYSNFIIIGLEFDKFNVLLKK